MVAFTGAGILYFLTMMPGLAWGDSGNAQLRVLLGHWYDHQYLVRSHVPYYIITSALAASGLAPTISANVVSAAAGAITVANVAVLLALLTKRRTAIACGATVLLFSHCLWHQATMAEVMTTSTMFMTSELVLLVLFLRRRRIGWLLTAMLLNGLHLAIHHLAALNWPAYLMVLFVICNILPKPHVRWLAPGTILFLLGASPLLAVFYVGWQTHHDLATVLAEMATGRFGPNVFNLSLNLAMVGRIVGYIGYSFPTPLLLLMPVGILALWRSQTRNETVLILIPLIVHFLFAIRYNVPDQHAFMLHTFVFLAILMGLGVDRFLAKRQSNAWRLAALVLPFTAPVLYTVVPDLIRSHAPNFEDLASRRLPYHDPYDWFLRPWRCGNRGPEAFAHEVLDALPPNAVLAVDTAAVAPLVYIQVRDNLRRDIQIHPAEWYQAWFDTPINLESPAFTDAIRRGRVFTLTDRFAPTSPLAGPQFAFLTMGPVYRVAISPQFDTPTPD